MQIELDLNPACSRWEVIKECVDKYSIEVKRIVEIGVYYGDMSNEMRKIFPEAELYLIDPWQRYHQYDTIGGNVWSNDAEDAYLKVVKHFAGDENTFVLRMSSEEAAKYIDGPFDIVFIDGNHSYEFVLNDIKSWMPKIPAGGLICGHDYARHGNAFGVKKAVTEMFRNDHFAVTVDQDDVWLKLV